MAKNQGMVDGAIASYNNFFDQEGGKAGLVIDIENNDSIAEGRTT